MKKHLLTASAAVLGLAGIAWAATSGSPVGSGPAPILLPSTAVSAASAPIVRATPTTGLGDLFLAADGKHLVDSYICMFRAGAIAQGSERAEASRSVATAGGSLGHVYDVALQGFSIHASAQGIAQMQAHNPRIQSCEQDAVASIINPINAVKRPGGGGGVTQPVQSTPLGITTIKGGVDATGKIAWVIDTGIDLTHPDLNVSPQGNGNDGQSANFVTGETSANDLNGHGSHVSGTIAAKNNAIGVVGVAANATVIAVRVLNQSGSGSYSDVIAGVNYVAKFGQPGQVANMSLGGPVSDILDTAVLNASNRGIWFALAAGNDGGDANLHSPGRTNGTYIRTVAAYDASNGLWASFSNYNPAIVDFAEPGVSVYSTWMNGGYNTISGTSMATPHMAGILLLNGAAVNSVGSVTRTGTTEAYIIGSH